jgi:hypothetical protein
MDTPADRRASLDRLRQQQRADLERLLGLSGDELSSDEQLLEREALTQRIAGRELTLGALEQTVRDEIAVEDERLTSSADPASSQTSVDASAPGNGETNNPFGADFNRERAGELFESAFDRVAKEVPMSAKSRLIAELVKDQVRDRLKEAGLIDDGRPKK